MTDPLCALCGKPFTDGQQRVYMGLEVGIRDVWCHRECYNSRYQPQGQRKAERAVRNGEGAEVQGVMELAE